jgi:hypothetical protein
MFCCLVTVPFTEPLFGLFDVVRCLVSKPWIHGLLSCTLTFTWAPCPWFDVVRCLVSKPCGPGLLPCYCTFYRASFSLVWCCLLPFIKACIHGVFSCWIATTILCPCVLLPCPLCYVFICCFRAYNNTLCFFLSLCSMLIGLLFCCVQVSWSR